MCTCLPCKPVHPHALTWCIADLLRSENFLEFLLVVVKNVAALMDSGGAVRATSFLASL